MFLQSFCFSTYYFLCFCNRSRSESFKNNKFYEVSTSCHFNYDAILLQIYFDSLISSQNKQTSSSKTKTDNCWKTQGRLMDNFYSDSNEFNIFFHGCELIIIFEMKFIYCYGNYFQTSSTIMTYLVTTCQFDCQSTD